MSGYWFFDVFFNPLYTHPETQPQRYKVFLLLITVNI